MKLTWLSSSSCSWFQGNEILLSLEGKPSYFKTELSYKRKCIWPKKTSKFGKKFHFLLAKLVVVGAGGRGSFKIFQNFIRFPMDLVIIREDPIFISSIASVLNIQCLSIWDLFAIVCQPQVHSRKCFSQLVPWTPINLLVWKSNFTPVVITSVRW